MKRYCDLHTHSVFSDGTCTPSQLIQLAEEAELAAVALCDHNTVAGLDEFHAAAEGREIEAVSGVELSTEYLGQDLHILGLYIDSAFYGELTEMLEEVNRRKAQANRDTVERLAADGYAIDYDEICAQTPGGHINRAHLAAALTAKGYVASISEAFDTLLSEKSGYYRVPQRISAMDAIRYLKSIGAVALLAHPFFDLNEQELEEFLRQALPCGLDGMEILYSTFSESEREIARRIADKYALVPSGGSDFHGANKPDIAIGRGRGDLFVPLSFLEAVKERKKRDKIC